VAASNSAHSHLSRSPQYGHTHTHFSIEFPHSTQMANSSSEMCFEPITFHITKYYKWFKEDISKFSVVLWKKKFCLPVNCMILHSWI